VIIFWEMVRWFADSIMKIPSPMERKERRDFPGFFFLWILLIDDLPWSDYRSWFLSSSADPGQYAKSDRTSFLFFCQIESNEPKVFPPPLPPFP